MGNIGSSAPSAFCLSPAPLRLLSDKYLSIQVDEILKNTSATPSRPSKTISSAFEPHMGVFVDAQDKYVAISIPTLFEVLFISNVEHC